MVNKRKDRIIPDGFIKYDGQYEKCWYDVYTWNGAIFKHCWPNADTFHSESGQCIDGKNIFAIKAEVSSGSFYKGDEL